jgi:hypothetical protein
MSKIDIVLKIFIIILIISIFYLLSKRYIENFSNQDDYFKGYNTRLNYRNTGIYPWERHNIYSSLPNDVTLKYDTAYYYEYGNDDYETKLKKIFKNDCKKLIIAVEGTNWTQWRTPRCIVSKESNCGSGYSNDMILDYYNKIYNYIITNINNSDELILPDEIGKISKSKIQVVHDIMKRYRINKDQKDYLMFDIEMILYRKNKLHGKHVKFYVITDNNNINVISLKILGIVNEDNIAMHPVLAKDEYDDLNKDFGIFIPEASTTALKYNRTTTDYNEIYEGTEKLEESLLEEQLYNKLETNYDTELVDTTSDNYELTKNINDDNYSVYMKNVDLKYLKQKADEKYREDVNNKYINDQNTMRLKFLNDILNEKERTKNYKVAAFKN